MEENPTIEQMLVSLHHSNSECYFSFCPFCRTGSLLMISYKRPPEVDPTGCIFCGEVDPIYKFQYCINKILVIMELITENTTKQDEKNFRSNRDEIVERILYEQCVVILATGIEVFLRESYSTLMNSRFVKATENLYSNFYEGARNIFTNYGKSKSLIKKNLKIDLSKGMSKTDSKQIILLYNKRHIIVHNNGTVDKSFIKNTGMDFKIGSKLPIDIEGIDDDIEVVQKFISTIKTEYDKVIGRELLDYFNIDFSQSDVNGISDNN